MNLRRCKRPQIALVFTEIPTCALKLVDILDFQDMMDVMLWESVN